MRSSFGRLSHSLFWTQIKNIVDFIALMSSDDQISLSREEFQEIKLKPLMLAASKQFLYKRTWNLFPKQEQDTTSMMRLSRPAKSECPTARGREKIGALLHIIHSKFLKFRKGPVPGYGQRHNVLTGWHVCVTSVLCKICVVDFWQTAMMMKGKARIG